MSDREIMNAKGFTVMDNDERVFRDPVVKRVVEKFRTRSDVGFKKYGTTLDEERTTKMKGLMKYLIDIQEELMDVIPILYEIKRWNDFIDMDDFYIK